TMMTCHPSIRPAATCTVSHTQIISRQPPATCQHPIGQPPVTWHLRQHRSTTVNAAGHRSTPSVNDGQRRRITMASQSWAWSGSGSGLGRVWIGSGPGPPCGMPRVSHVCTRVSHVCPRGIHMDADVDNMPYVGIDPGTSWIKT
nr:hypothetical protein [Tanacetum cinerariifolium]GFB30737.1 hypothetical protein [Tanacetum cinerariifolium]